MAHTLLYGGTFDPIHHGHLITCQRAREVLGADSVLFIPAQISPHKLTRQSAAADHRMAMLHRAIAGNPFFRADGRELLREGPSYTVDTLASLREESRGERFTLLIGADQLARFHTWRRVEEMVEGPARVEIAILGRPGSTNAEGLRAVAENLGAGAAEKFANAILATPLVEISGTEIRQRIQANLSIDYLVPEGVAEYIREHGLYRDSV